MPMYEYKCAKCGDVFELIQKFSDEPLKEHPGCGGAVERLVSAAALQFKGSGWYVNDYGKNGGSGSAGRAKSESAENIQEKRNRRNIQAGCHPGKGKPEHPQSRLAAGHGFRPTAKFLIAPRRPCAFRYYSGQSAEFVLFQSAGGIAARASQYSAEADQLQRTAVFE